MKLEHAHSRLMLRTTADFVFCLPSPLQIPLVLVHNPFVKYYYR